MSRARCSRWTTAIAGLLCCAAAAGGCGGGSSTSSTSTSTSTSTNTQAISAGEQAKLRQIAEAGGPLASGPASDIKVVKTTYSQFQRVLGGPPNPGAGEVYVISERRTTRVPSGQSFPYLVSIVDAKTNRRLIAIPMPAAPPLSRLGPVTSL